MEIQTIDPTEQSILQEKITRKLSNASDKMPIIRQIQEESEGIEDYVVPIGKDSPKVNFRANGVVSMHFENNDSHSVRNVHKHAIGQFADKLGIPSSYLKELSIGKEQWERDLASNLLNEHSLYNESKRYLLRTLNGEVKGVLSDKYRRLNTAEIYAEFFNACVSQGAQLIDCCYDVTRTYIEFILPEVVPVQTQHNGTTYMVFGLRISNSDYGDGALRVQSYSMQVVCLNGMTRDNLIRQVHLGKKLPDNLILSNETYKLDTETQASLVRDIVNSAFDSSYLLNEIQNIEKAGSKLINLDHEVKLLPKLGMRKEEVKSLTDILSDNNPEHGVQGRNTIWKLTQAMTQVGVQTGNTRRKRDIEDIAGKLINKI
tara:strand:+ start:1446 stop:2564 length:1119 start_codon:yes stop_codon:yes gene_type:complete